MPGTIKAHQDAIGDNNISFALIGHTGTAGTALTRRITTQANGAIYAHITGGTVVSSVTVDDINQVGTVGVLNSGSVVVTNGTVTVGNINNLGTLNVVEAGSINLIKAGTITRVEGGSVVITVGTVNVTTGSIVQTAGTLTTGTLQNLVSGT